MTGNISTDKTRLFTRLVIITALLTLGLVVFGAVVRVTNSGLGCGEHWPLCNGTIFPPLDNVIAWIEWLHRLYAVLIGLFGLGTLTVAIQAYRRQNRRVLAMTATAAVLFLVQSALGAIVVVFSLPPTAVTLHLGTAMLLLGALLVAAIFATYQPAIPRLADRVTALVYITTALSFVIILTGALVRGSGATLACTDWPLCNGEVFPTRQGQAQIVHMVHRYSVLALGVVLALLVWFMLRDRQDSQERTLAILAGAAYLSQAGIGALYVWERGAAVWGAAHVGMAAVTWSLLVVLSAREWLNHRKPLGEEMADKAWNVPSGQMS